MIYYLDIFPSEPEFKIEVVRLPGSRGRYDLENVTYLADHISKDPRFDETNEYTLVYLELPILSDEIQEWATDEETVKSRRLLFRVSELRYAEFLLVFS